MIVVEKSRSCINCIYSKDKNGCYCLCKKKNNRVSISDGKDCKYFKRENVNLTKDAIQQSERAKQLIEIENLKKTIRVLISALRYERGVDDVINYIAGLPVFNLKESDINRICLFIEKKIKEGEQRWN